MELVFGFFQLLLDERGVVHVEQGFGFLFGFGFGESGLRGVEEFRIAGQEGEGLGVRGLGEDAAELACEGVFEIEGSGAEQFVDGACDAAHAGVLMAD